MVVPEDRAPVTSEEIENLDHPVTILKVQVISPSCFVNLIELEELQELTHLRAVQLHIAIGKSWNHTARLRKVWHAAKGASMSLL
jgi:hypothetical protein